MARRGDSESKQGLTVALVLFVLLSLMLALIAYLGYADAAERAKERDEAKLLAEIQKYQAEEAKLYKAIYEVANGNLSPREVQKALQDLDALKRAKHRVREGDKVKTVDFGELYRNEIKKHTDKKFIEWDEFAEKPAKTYAERIQELEKALAVQTKLNIDLKSAHEDAKTQYQKEVAALREAKEKAVAMLNATKDDVDKRIQGLDANYKVVVKEFQDSIIKAEEFEKKIADLNKLKQEAEAKYEAALKDATLKLKKLEDKLTPLDVLAYDKAKAKITRIDPNNKTVHVNVGSADLVRPGLTFSVFGIGEYRPNAEAKGKIEVIRVVDRHLSLARVTEVRSATRFPILTGDELYNPAWNPGLQEHVAIAGLIDLTGDGRDGTVEFVKMLEKQGVVVDAYLDTSDLQIKGKGFNRQTSYLILGEIPEFQAQEQIREGDVRQERKKNINSKISEMRDEANKLGVQIVPARRFMALMGFELPRRPATADDWNSYTIRQSGLGGQPGAGAMMGKDMMKKDEMKKDEMKKDEK